jgi:putative peptidoglycan lipid II flippase
MTRSATAHAKVMAAFIFLSRLLGLARESVAAAVFGSGGAWAAFTFAFTLPNLFRKLLGEGALSAAFIPAYAAERAKGRDHRATRLAGATLRAQLLILLGVVIVGEAVLGGLLLLADEPQTILALVLGMVMLPYVVLVCSAALLSGVLQVHGRFGITAATAAALNLALIAAIALGAWFFDNPTTIVVIVAIGVLVAGMVQVAMLVPGLRASGFRLGRGRVWTPAVRRVLWASVPVAIGASVMQIGVLLDKGISFGLAGDAGWQPLADGAINRLNWAQFLYQFPLGVFAVALGTAIFPRLSAEAATDLPRFRSGLRDGVEAALFIGLPASVGLVMVAEPTVKLLFFRGAFDSFDLEWTVRSTMWYASGIWAYSLLQIVSRGYYALGDTRTPTIWAGINLVANLAVELPLLWTPLRESGMAVATATVFGIQAPLMLWLLSRRAGGIGLRGSIGVVGKMLIATTLMAATLAALPLLPSWTSWHSGLKLAVQLPIGGAVYFTACHVLGVRWAARLLRRG